MTIENARVTKLNFQNSDLMGNIPPELGNLTHLKRLIISGNDALTGNIPAELGNLANENAVQWKNTKNAKFVGKTGQNYGYSVAVINCTSGDVKIIHAPKDAKSRFAKPRFEDGRVSWK